MNWKIIQIMKQLRTVMQPYTRISICYTPFMRHDWAWPMVISLASFAKGVMISISRALIRIP